MPFGGFGQLRNDFSAQRTKPDLEESVFEIEDVEGYDVVDPLADPG